MALHQMLGFDVYPSQTEVSGFPVQGSGITGNGYADALQILRTVNTNNIIGVSDNVNFRQSANTPTDRKALMIRRSGNFTGHTAVKFLNSPPMATPTDKSYIAFTYRLASTFTLNGNAMQVCYLVTGLGNTVNNSQMLNVQGTNTTAQFSFCGQTIPLSVMPYLEMGREYHIEIRAFREPDGAAGTVSARLYVDGENVAYAKNFATVNVADTSGLFWYIGPLNVNVNVVYNALYSDIILASNAPGLFADGIGPTLILPSKVESVTGTWGKEGNATAAATLSDDLDTTYYSSPVDDGAMSVKFTPPAVGFKALASEVVVRASRDRDAGRQLVAEALGSNGAALNAKLNIATSSSYGFYTLPRIQDASSADTRSPTVRLNALVP